MTTTSDNNPNRSAFLDIINSVQGQLEKYVLENTVFYVSSYYNEEPDSSDYHEIPETSLPQLSVYFPEIEENKSRRTMYSDRIKDIPSLTYKDLGRPTYYDFNFTFDFLARSITEITELSERYREWVKDSYEQFKTDAGFVYYLDDSGSFSSANQGPNYSDFKMSRGSFTIRDVVMYGRKEYIGKLIKTVCIEVYTRGLADLKPTLADNLYITKEI